MKKIVLVSFLMILSGEFIFSQENCLNLIDEGKFAKASSKITSGLEKHPHDVILNYAMAKLLIQRGYNKYDPKQAYDYIDKTLSLYDHITDPKEDKEIKKTIPDPSVLLETKDLICKSALEDVIKINTVEGYENFLGYYGKAPYEIKEEAKKKRNIVAYKNACDQNTVESYQYFITTFPGAIQQAEAKSKRNSLAYEKTKSVNTIEAYKIFITTYPDAMEVKDAWSRIHEFAFKQAEKENTSYAYKKFIDEYSNSAQYPKALKLFENTQYLENTDPKSWKSNYQFVLDFPKNSMISVALDSVFAYGARTGDIHALKFCVDHMTGASRTKALLFYHDVFTDDGEQQTLDLFYEQYDDYVLTAVKQRDYELARMGDLLDLNNAYDVTNFDLYRNYIIQAAPKEKAFVALQRIVSNDIRNKNWSSAIGILNNYAAYFGKQDKKIMNLIELLQAKWDNSIKINSVGSVVNTKEGGEYVPVITADGKYLYFCGRDRKDNLWGEDIFYSKMNQGSWSTPKLVSDLSYFFSNDAPLNISADGNTMILFKSGDLYYSEKYSNGWYREQAFPERINSCDWQADAMITSDGNALLFASIRQGGYNTNNNELIYHGDGLHPCDIYVSLLDENNEWGEPVNLGPVINTRYCDRTPFLHPDMRTLYFSSDGHGGLGKLDVFKSTRLADTCWDCWSEPVNLGKEINTTESDWGYKISTDGEKAYFAKRPATTGENDIFWLNLPDHLRPDLVVTITGTIKDSDDNPVYAEIRWEDLETGKNVGQLKSDPADGTYFIVLPLGKMYGYYVNKPEYYPISNNIDLRNFKMAREIKNDIILTSYKEMVEDTVSVPINNLFFNFDESTILPYSIPELKRLANIIKSKNYRVEISGHTDSVGTDEYNQALSERRAAAVKDFLVAEGCSQDRLITKGYGRSKPVDSNESDEGRAKNRRVEIRFIT